MGIDSAHAKGAGPNIFTSAGTTSLNGQPAITGSNKYPEYYQQSAGMHAILCVPMCLCLSLLFGII